MFKRREKMFNTTNHQGILYQNHSDIPHHPCPNGYHQKKQKVTNIVKDVEKRETLCVLRL